MKKTILSLYLTIICLFAFVSSNAQFRQIDWGSGYTDIVNKHGEPDLFKEDGYISYTTKLKNLDGIATFYLLEDKLYSGAYMIMEKHTNQNDYIDDYNMLKSTLIKKYGEPVTDKTLWKNDLFKDDYSDWGTAISLGHLVYGAQWLDEKNMIFCYLKGDNYKIELGIVYKSIELQDEVKESNEEENLDDF